MTPDDFEVAGAPIAAEVGSVALYCPVDDCHWSIDFDLWTLGELRALAQAHLDEAHPRTNRDR